MPKLDDFFAAGLARLPENQRLPNNESLPAELRQAIVSASVPGLLDEPRDGILADQVKQHADGLPPLVVSGLWLLAGDLDRSHQISQGDSSPEGSFWHGIMHRREGDFSNAKYWFRRVGEHAVFARLAEEHPDTFTDPFTLVDQVEKACGRRASDPSVTQSLLMVQWTEWQLLTLECWGLECWGLECMDPDSSQSQ